MPKITFGEAKNILEKIAGDFKKASSKQRAEKEVYLSKNLIAKKGIETSDGVFHTAPYKNFWLGFVNDKAEANWMHSCRYVFISEYGGNAVIDSIYPLNNEERFDLEQIL